MDHPRGGVLLVRGEENTQANAADLERDRDARASAPRRRHDAMRARGASAAVGRGRGAARAGERLGGQRPGRYVAVGKRGRS